jgi:hypothetical protein
MTSPFQVDEKWGLRFLSNRHIHNQRGKAIGERERDTAFGGKKKASPK